MSLALNLTCLWPPAFCLSDLEASRRFAPHRRSIRFAPLNLRPPVLSLGSLWSRLVSVISPLVRHSTGRLPASTVHHTTHVCPVTPVCRVLFIPHDRKPFESTSRVQYTSCSSLPARRLNVSLVCTGCSRSLTNRAQTWKEAEGDKHAICS